MTAVVLGSERAVRDIRAGLAAPIDGVSLAVASLPEPARAPADDDHEAAIAIARKAYVEADFPACRRALDPIDALALLDGQRTIAARVLMWRVACHVGEGDRDGARRDATAIAVAGLALPPEISGVTPDVEAVIAEAASRVAKARTASLRVVANPAGARLSIDGSADTCITPCTVTLAAGAHRIGVAADGFTTTRRRVQLPDERSLAIELVEAAPPAIAAQLQLRIARGAAVDDPATLALAARAVRARQIVVLAATDGPPARLIGALYADGRVTARGERMGTLSPGAATDLARDLVADGRVAPAQPLWRRPRFWIIVGGVAALATSITAYVAFKPDPQSRVVFP
jgi:hypothetical protein